MASRRRSREELPEGLAGFQGSPFQARARLRRAGLDPGRLSAARRGLPAHRQWRGRPPWFRRLSVGATVWIAIAAADYAEAVTPRIEMWGSLLVGLLIIQASVDALLTGTERLAVRSGWDHYVSGTVAEVFSTLPEFVVIAFIVPVSPKAALIIAFVTIYNNALVFSIYSFVLPKNEEGVFVMPQPITEAGTQVLVGGAAIGALVAFVMLSVGGQGESIGPPSLIVIGLIMWVIFGVYLFKLLQGYQLEETALVDALDLDDEDIAERREQLYADVAKASPGNVLGIFVVGVAAAFLGGERVSSFANSAIEDLQLSEVATAVILAAFAGMSEYVIIWKAHRRGQHQIALANAFGGITQVMFLVLPFALLAVGVYQGTFGSDHVDLPIQFDVSFTLLAGLLFPTFYVLVALLEEDHTFGVLDTAIMTAISLLTLLAVLAYGA